MSHFVTVDRAAVGTSLAPDRRANVTAHRRGHLTAGARAMAPWLLGLVPFGLVIGIQAADAGLRAAGWLSGPLVFAGSSQLVAIELLGGGAAPLVVLAAALVANLRLVLYSAAMAPHWQGTTRAWRAFGAYFLVDPTVSVGLDASETSTTAAEARLRYLGGALTLWVAWVAAIGVGAFAGSALPTALRLDLVIPLYLVAQVVPRLRDRVTVLAAAVSAATAVIGTWMPINLGDLVAILAGLSVALVAQRTQP